MELYLLGELQNIVLGFINKLHTLQNHGKPTTRPLPLNQISIFADLKLLKSMQFFISMQAA